MDVDHTNPHILRQSAETSSIHGVRQLSLTYHHSKFVLAAWIFTILMAFITICYQITTLTSLILTYPSTIGVSISLEQSVFPTVTACNMGVYKKSVVENIDTFAQMSQALASVTSSQRQKREAPEDIDIQSVEGSVEKPRVKRQMAPCAYACNISGEFCYIYYPSGDRNTGSQSTCASVGGKLPFFATMAQYSSYNAYQASFNAPHPFWLGAWNYSPHNKTDPGVWQDTNGTGTALNFSSWYTGQPNTGGACLYASGGFWSDNVCSDNVYVPFFCMCQCPAIANGILIGPSVPTVYYTAQLQCNNGYQLVGKENLTCVPNPSGSGLLWNSTSSCVAITTTSTTTTSTITTTTTTPTATITTTTVTIAAAAQIPAVSTAQFVTILTTNTNGTTDAIAAASQLNSAMEILTSSLKGAALQELGFQQKDFITSCLFSGMPCNNEEKLTLVQIPEFLNCYAFNHRDQHSLSASQRSGEKFGLSMSFNIHSEEYLNTMSVAGVQLFVQEQIDPILPGSMGRVYSPGLIYYITISKRIENQLSLPGRTCITSPMEIPFNLFKNDTYFTESCLRSYLQLNIIRNCGCGSTKYPLPNDNSKFCDLTTAKCASDYLTSNGVKLIEEAQKACPIACHSVSFDLTTTFARLSPQFNFQRSLLENLNMTRSAYMNNIVMVKVFFAKDTVMVYTEELNFGVVSIFANLGGSLGCIAGLSVISIAEMIFMVANVVAMMKKKCR